MRIQWDHYFIAMAKLAASRSGCNSRPTGAVIVKGNRIISTGYNGTIAGQKQCTDYGPDYCLHRFRNTDDSGGLKYQDCPSIHAEQNAINQIASIGGIGLRFSSIYCTLQPCIFCLKNIASVGIQKIYYELPYRSNDPERDKYWTEQLERYDLLAEQITLPPDTKATIFDLMCHETSKRKLK
jgi:dCMP deaminase